MEQIVRPTRRPLIPRWVWVSAVATCVLLLGAVGSIWYLDSSSGIQVPDVTGLPSGQAEADLSRSGLESAIGERRFSSLDEGVVIDQDPPSGSTAGTGDVVTLIVSAGSEDFDMPDVVGNGILSARSILENAGLVVKIDVIESEVTVDTVLQTYPAPGSRVRTGETVRLTLAGEGTASAVLLPYQLEGLTFVIDPAEQGSDEVDVALEVSRRLQSLLEASGGTVVVTRSLADVTTSVQQRQERATVTSATAAIGIDVSARGTGGTVVRSQVPAGSVGSDVGSTVLMEDLVSTLREVSPEVVAGPATTDTVLSMIGRPSARILLGSLDDEGDVTQFRDPTWADSIARSIYRVLGERYGIQ